MPSAYVASSSAGESLTLSPTHEDLEKGIDRSGRGPGARHHRRCRGLPEPEEPGDGADRVSAKGDPGLGGQRFG